jgi:nucleoside-diphosphate kinase
MEKTFVILKPDCMRKGTYSEVLGRFHRANLKIVAAKLTQLSPQKLREHYAHIADKPFYPAVEQYMSSCPVLMLVLEGTGAIDRVRALLGPTDSQAAPAGTIRGDMGVDKSENVCHASDGPETAKIEIERFFDPSEICAS